MSVETELVIVDAHLDLAYNAVRGREVHRTAREQKADEDGIPSVGLPDLRKGNVGLICGTIFAEPSRDNKPGYRTPAEAEAMGWAQMQWYLRQMAQGTIDLVTEKNDLCCPPTTNQQVIVLMEGADPIVSPADVRTWFDLGVRIVGLAWKRTRYAGGTGDAGPLTSEGIELVKAMDQVGMIHDVSHLAEESFWQLMEISAGAAIASHSNCRAIVPTDRQLSDAMILALVERGGVIGINFYDKFLLPPTEKKRRRAKLSDVVQHVKHICQLVGDAKHVGLGTDMDGGLGREQIPEEIQTSADLPRVAEALAAGGFSDEDIRRIMGGNWIEYFQRELRG